MKVSVFNTQGADTGRQVELPEAIFGIEPNKHAVWLDVKAYLANQRQGTAETKERNLISGSTRKLHKQKGTGGSRKGDIKNPVFRGGGTIFGPNPRDYSEKVNKKVKTLARKSVLSDKAAQGKVMVIEDFSFDKPRTKELSAVLKNLKVLDKKALFVIPDYDQSLILSGRNLPKTRLLHARDLNTYSILHSNVVVVAESALPKLEETLLSTAK
ncbi:MAG TPA: 50S ribosomal protein L4 [Saprospiraceae bacterium]|nr:50S ribosomal protein L4 [Saprospiraceae bacterium]HNT21180.1 50S ribosomal protein L4 [Saprospiraceae bacterium]